LGSWTIVRIELRQGETHDDFKKSLDRPIHGDHLPVWRYARGTGLFDDKFSIEVENADDALLVKLASR